MFYNRTNGLKLEKTYVLFCIFRELLDFLKMNFPKIVLVIILEMSCLETGLVVEL